ncbi:MULTISPECIES: GNAT family N-acetyltransferase [Cytobacillus]|uniref:GNAT family N-acetyltransferase n=1 Tax=Cytobacillus stercorigallinarum TaxID=2762240 RepID=A0ABR8QIY1_9BACI|nr:GNAT family N-acetyltransferase [Cytobacillus stercorigallinarum]MBD7935480.1 GNAT family N-acetyltransferase [Cytobacillus stercorigallinarum]
MLKVHQALLADLDDILTLEKSIVEENRFFITTNEEFSANIDEERKKLSAILTQSEKNAVAFVAKSDNSVVGCIIFRSSSIARLAHHGSFSIYVDSSYRKKGIGVQLLQTLIKWAEEHPVIEKLCLGVFSTNQPAIHLYQKMGFVEEGRKIKDIKLSDDEYVDDVLMYKMV